MTANVNIQAWNVLIWQLIARFPVGMMTVGVLTWAEEKYQSYTLGGVLVACFTLGFASGAIIAAKLFSKLPAILILRFGALISVLGMVTLVIAQLSFFWTILTTLVIGIFFPPVTPLARSIYARAFFGLEQSRMYSIDSIAQEFIWIFAPIIAVFVAGIISPATVIIVCAFFTLVGTVGFTVLQHVKTFSSQISNQTNVPVKRMPIQMLGYYAIGFFLVASGAFIEITVVEHFGYESITAGIMLAGVAFGSLVGGVTLARRPVLQYSLPIRLSLIILGLILTVIATEPILFGIGLVLSGFGIAPSFTAMHSCMAAISPPEKIAEGFAYANTMQLIGAASGAAIAGFLAGEFGSRIALLTASLSVTIAVAIALIIALFTYTKDASGT